MSIFSRMTNGMMSAPQGMMGAMGSGGLGSIMGRGRRLQNRPGLPGMAPVPTQIPAAPMAPPPAEGNAQATMALLQQKMGMGQSMQKPMGLMGAIQGIQQQRPVSPVMDGRLQEMFARMRGGR